MLLVHLNDVIQYASVIYEITASQITISSTGMTSSSPDINSFFRALDCHIFFFGIGLSEKINHASK